MRILVISQYFWPENFRINDLLSGLVEQGNEVTVLTGIPNYPEGKFFSGYSFFNKTDEEYNGVKIVRVPIIPRGKSSMLRLVINYASYLFSACFFAPFLLRKRFDVILFALSPFTEGIPALFLKKLLKAPVIYWAQDLWPESLSATGAIKSPFILGVIRRFIDFIYKHCERVIVQSRAFIPAIESRGVDIKKIYYLPNAAEELYKPVQLEPDAPERAKIPDGFIVMFAGNIGAAQDFPTILAAAECLKTRDDIHWVIVGDGRMREWVEAQVRERGLEKTVHLIGRYPLEVMPRFFALADIMLVTLKDEYIFSLTIPSKIQSYMACAKPIVAAINGEGARIIIESGSGIVSAAEDPEGLAKAIMVSKGLNKMDLEIIGQNSRKFFEQNFERNYLLEILNGWLKDTTKLDKKGF